MMVVLELVETAGWSGRGAYTIDVFPREERVQSQAFMRAALNIGFTLGALISGIALAFDSDDLILQAVPVFTALILGAQRLLHHPAPRRRPSDDRCDRAGRLPEPAAPSRRPAERAPQPRLPRCSTSATACSAPTRCCSTS